MVVEDKNKKQENMDEEQNEHTAMEEEKDVEADAPEAEEEKAADAERVEELEDRYLRLQADYSNFRRRSNEEKSKMFAMGLEKLALAVLPVLDNFERALAVDDVKDEKFYEGMEMIAKQFKSELEKEGVVEIEAQDAPFDPNLHHAVMMEEKEGVEPNTVIEVLQKGYRIDDRVIRPSMVKVSK